MDKINERYKNLLMKFVNNKDLEELIELVTVDNEREREVFYIENKRFKYPDRRDLLGKLKMDLFTVKKHIDLMGG